MVSARNQMSFEFPIGEPTDLCLGDMMDCDVPESYFLSKEKIAGFTPLPAKADSGGIVIDGDLNDPKNLEIWNRVYSPLGLSPTLTALSGGGTVPRVHVIGVGGGGESTSSSPGHRRKDSQQSQTGRGCAQHSRCLSGSQGRRGSASRSGHQEA